MQWGISNAYQSYEIQHINFPIPFPHTALSVSITQSLEEIIQNNLTANIAYANDRNDVGTWLLSKSNTGFSWYSEAIQTEMIPGKNYKCHWFAIGY